MEFLIRMVDRVFGRSTGERMALALLSRIEKMAEEAQTAAQHLYAEIEANDATINGLASRSTQLHSTAQRIEASGAQLRKLCGGSNQ